VSAIVTSLLYITIGLALAAIVGRALTRSGRAFLRTRFDGQDGVADAVDRLLVVAFYLLAAGFIALTVPAGAHLADGGQALRLLSIKLGELLLVLGALHLASTIAFARLRGSRASAMQSAGDDDRFAGGPGAGADGLSVSRTTLSGSSLSGSSLSDSSLSDSSAGDSAIGDSADYRFGPASRRAPRPLAPASPARRAATATVGTPAVGTPPVGTPAARTAGVRAAEIGRASCRERV